MIRFNFKGKSDVERLKELKAKRMEEEKKTELAILIAEEEDKIRKLKNKRKKKTSGLVVNIGDYAKDISKNFDSK